MTKYEGYEYHGLFYESVGDGLPPLLLHNCRHLPLGPGWRMYWQASEGALVYIEPLDVALEGFANMGWALE